MMLDEQVSKLIEDVIAYLEMLPAVVIVHDVKNWSVVYMSSRGLALLGTSMQALTEMGQEYFGHYFNQEEAKEYVPKIFGLLQRNNDEEMTSFFQQVKVKVGEKEEWQLWLSSTKIFMRDADGNVLLTLTVTVPVAADHNIDSKVERLIEENSFLRRHKNSYSLLTKREREILRLMALDKTSNVIAEQLYLSEATVKTHRRNIKRKIDAKNQYDIVRFAQAFELV